MEDELISVIVTTCNRKQEILKRALDSVAAQTYRPIEMIVVIDQPSTAEELSRFLSACYGNMIKVHVNEKQMGPVIRAIREWNWQKGNTLPFWTMTMSGCRRNWKSSAKKCFRESAWSIPIMK